MALKILFSGCSYVAGNEFPLGRQDTDLFCNIMMKEHPALQGKQIVNIAQGGWSNDRIFRETASHLLTDDYEYAFVGWTSLQRFETRPVLGPEISINPIPSNIHKWMLTSIHDHYQFMNVLLYSNILLNMKKNTKLFLYNALLCLNQNWVRNHEVDLFQEIDEATKNPLKINNTKRTALHDYIVSNGTQPYDERLKFVVHEDIKHAGGIDRNYWLTLWHGIPLIDQFPGGHPGVQSNREFATRIMKSLDEKLSDKDKHG